MSHNPNERKPVQVIAISAGKGGVGKTSMAINLSVALAKQRRKVMLFDADLSLANVDVLLGLRPSRTIADVVAGRCHLQDICLDGPEGIRIIPAASGVQKMAELSVTESSGLIQAFSELTDDVDTLIVDTAAGISSQVLNFISAAQEVIVVVCNEPASIADAYALIKLCHQEHQIDRFWVLSNMIRTTGAGKSLYNKLCQITGRFLQVNLHYLGEVPYDEYMYVAARARQAVLEQFPGSRAGKALHELGQLLAHWQPPVEPNGKMSFFWERLLQRQLA